MDFSIMKEYMSFLANWRIPGNSIAIYHKNNKVFEWQAGYADMEKQIPMTNEYLFNIHSCSKIATVTAALQLYERGKFLLDDPLYEYLPEYRTMYVRNADGSIQKAQNPITIRQLFTMTAGFDYDSSIDSFQEARRITNGKMDTRTVIRCLASEPLSFEPGTRWQYSFCHDVLATVVEVISGKKFREYVQEHLFDPLEMHDSYYHNDVVPNDAIRNRIAEKYQYVSEKTADRVTLQAFGDSSSGVLIKTTKQSEFIHGAEFDSGGSGITTSVDDYARFASALATGGVGVNKERILSSASIDLLRTNQLSQSLLKDFKWPQLRGYGYGLGVRTLLDKAASGSLGPVGEFGWGGAAGATVLVDPENQLSMFYTHHMITSY